MEQLQVRRLGYALGAQVTGIDLRRTLDDVTVAAIRKLWLDHSLLCFPAQQIDREQLTAFARRFGELEPIRTPRKNAEPETLYFEVLTNKGIDGKPADVFKGGAYWHTDESFTLNPTSAAFLSCKEIPPVGGDTLFANTYMAYETLSPAMQAIVESLSAIHDHPIARRHLPQHIPAVQPLVRTHPETGRKALYVGTVGTRVRGIAGMSDEEGRPLLEFLNRHAVSYEFTYRHHWTVNDVVMWDNRCLLHYALRDYDRGRQIRFMERTAVIGEPSGELYAS